jgi:hypothetical protein
MVSVLPAVLIHLHTKATSDSEQLTPMLGLTDLQHAVHPETTLDKIHFLWDNTLTHFHPHTTVISFTALLALVCCRNFKNMFKKYWFIYRMPEVLLVVAASTGASDPNFDCNH